MKKEDLFQALGEVDDAFLDENVTEIRHSTGWVTAFFSIAACAALTVGLIHFVPKPVRNPETPVSFSEIQTTTAVVHEIPEVSEETAPEEIPDFVSSRLYLSVDAKNYDPEKVYSLEYDEAENLWEDKNWIFMHEMQIDEKNGYVSLQSAYSSTSFPAVGVLEKTESGYQCQISGMNFTLERLDDFALLCHCEENHLLDGEIFSSQIALCHPFAEISTGNPELDEVLHQLIICAPTLCHEEINFECILAATINSREQHIGTTDAFLMINDRLYHTDENSRSLLANWIRKNQSGQAETWTETQIQTVTANTSTTTASVTATAETSVFSGTRIARDTYPDETFLSPSETEISDTQSEPVQIHYTVITTTATTTVTTTAPPETAATETSAVIPESMQNNLLEEDGVFYVRDSYARAKEELQPGLEILNCLKSVMEVYPDQQYAVDIELDYTDDSQYAFLHSYGIVPVALHDTDYPYITAIVTKDDLQNLAQEQTRSIRIDLTSYDSDYVLLQKNYIPADDVIYAKYNLYDDEVIADIGEILTADGKTGAENLEAVRIYPGMRYAVWVKLGAMDMDDWSFWNNDAIVEEQRQLKENFTIEGYTLEQAQQENNTRILEYFSGMTNWSSTYVMWLGGRLASYGYEVVGYNKSCNKIWIIADEEQLKNLPVIKTFGYSVGIMAYQDEDYFRSK